MYNITHTSVVPHVIATCLESVTDDWVHSTVVHTPWAVQSNVSRPTIVVIIKTIAPYNTEPLYRGHHWNTDV